jgi:hypothetical protein
MRYLVVTVTKVSVTTHNENRGESWSGNTGKCPESSTVFALKSAHLPPIMNNCDLSPESMALEADYDMRRL